MEKHNQEEAETGRNSDVEKARREKIRDGESQKREDAAARKGRKAAKHCVFPMFCGPGGSKSRLASVNLSRTDNMQGHGFLKVLIPEGLAALYSSCSLDQNVSGHLRWPAN